MSKSKKKVKFSKIDSLIIELKSYADKRIFTGSDLITARSLLSYYIAGIELSFKQIELIRILNAKCKTTKQKSEPAKKHNLYAVSNGEHVKLGISTNIGKRIKSMQTSSAKELNLVWRFYVGKNKKIAYQYEKKLHKLCKKHKVKGEWFELDCMSLVNKFKR